MPSVKAAPRNEILWRIAQALNRTRSFLNPAPDTPLAGVDWFRPGNLLMGNFPEEVREWSYGNSPFSVKPLGDKIPQPKRTTWERMDTGEKETTNRAISAMDGLLAAPTELAAKGAVGGAPLLMGAVRKGGNPYTVATHTTAASPRKIENIAEKGLYAPSIGLTYKAPSDYNPHNPHYVFKEGVLDRPFPDQIPTGIWNRDAFVWNPWHASDNSIEKQWENHGGPSVLAKASEDMRLTQMSPGESHSAAILASPNFGSLRDWEDSSLGLGALYTKRLEDQGMPHRVRDYDWMFKEQARRAKLGQNSYNSDEFATEQMKAFLRSIPILNKDSSQLGLMRDDIQSLYQLARTAPSDMAEMKIYAPSVPATPEEARIFLPPGSAFSRKIFEDVGYDVWDANQLDRLAAELKEVQTGPDQYRVDLLTAPGLGLRSSDYNVRGQSMSAQPLWPFGVEKPLTGMAGKSPLVKPLAPGQFPADEPFMDALDEASAYIPGPAFSPKMSEKFPQLWEETLHWFQGDYVSQGTLAQYLGKMHDLPAEEIAKLQAIWDAPGLTFGEVAVKMQNYIATLLNQPNE